MESELFIHIRELDASGELTARNMESHAADLAACMNHRAAQSADYCDDCDISVVQVTLALMKAKRVFGQGALGMRLINRRLLDAVGDIAGRPIDPIAFWGENAVQLPARPYHAAEIGRRAYEHFLPVLDRPHNRHIQTLERLAVEADIHYSAIHRLFTKLNTAYYVDNGNKEPAFLIGGTLMALSHALHAKPVEIVAPDLWQEAVTLVQRPGRSRLKPPELAL